MTRRIRAVALIGALLVLAGCSGVTGEAVSNPGPSTSGANNADTDSSLSPERKAAEEWLVPAGFTRIDNYVAVRALGPGEASCTASSLCWVFEVVTPINCRVKLDAVETDGSGRISAETFQTALVPPGSFGVIEFAPTYSDSVALEVVKASCFR